MVTAIEAQGAFLCSVSIYNVCPMTEVLPYLAVPSIVLIVVSLIATLWMPSTKISPALQHLVAGIIFATVATELVPEILKGSNIVVMLMGYGTGILLIL